MLDGSTCRRANEKRIWSARGSERTREVEEESRVGRKKKGRDWKYIEGERREYDEREKEIGRLTTSPRSSRLSPPHPAPSHPSTELRSEQY